MGPENTPNVITSKIKTWIGDIMYGNVSHKWGVVIPERAEEEKESPKRKREEEETFTKKNKRKQ